MLSPRPNRPLLRRTHRRRHQKIVASIADPNPLVSGQGFERLRAAGIAVEVGPGAAESRELNTSFFSRMIRKTPWVRMKMAAPPDAHLLIAGRACIINAAVQNYAKKSALEARGATVVMLPDAHGKVGLAAMMKDLGRREINELHVEAGSKLNGSLIRAGLVDEFLVYLASKLLGPGQGMASFGPLQTLAEAVELQFQSTDRVGADLRIVARIAGRDQF